jgi:hypothetical protein
MEAYFSDGSDTIALRRPGIPAKPLEGLFKRFEVDNAQVFSWPKKQQGGGKHGIGIRV